jgi:hypothetical protein
MAEHSPTADSGKVIWEISVQKCLTGAGNERMHEECFDTRLDGDLDVDQDDFRIFVGYYSGPHMEPTATRLPQMPRRTCTLPPALAISGCMSSLPQAWSSYGTG